MHIKMAEKPLQQNRIHTFVEYPVLYGDTRNLHHGFDILVGQIHSDLLHCRLQFALVDEAIVVLVEGGEKSSDLHLFGMPSRSGLHHPQKLLKIYQTIV